MDRRQLSEHHRYLTLEDADYTYNYNWQRNRTRKTSKAAASYRQFIYDHRNRLTMVATRNATHELEGYVLNHYDTFGGH